MPPGYEESVQQRQPDPPIYRALLARWADDGRTLPGRRDPEWSRVAGAPIWPSGPLFGDQAGSWSESGPATAGRTPQRA
ncbi:hypothetical protein AB0B01_20175 [Streptomyces sp. NPDC044571]|uniref:hypothetical protein n=1 Tax=Streptomyces sp. NPDC044571 TaxID=3155371 RepID=UPI0033D2193A